MGDLISRNDTKLKVAQRLVELKYSGASWSDMALCALDAIDDVPAVDAEPVRRGDMVETSEPVILSAWMEIEQAQWGNSTPRIKCAKCGAEPRPYINKDRSMEGTTEWHTWLKTRYCPNCGAKMEGIK